jgi:cytoskeleton protein RodZ
MQSVGTIIRNSRLAQGRTIEQLNSNTRISLRQLEAIESDDLTQFSSAFFYKSFVRQVADNLSIDFAEISSAVQEFAERIPQPRMPGEGDAAAPKVAAMPVRRRGGPRWIVSFLSFALALTVCSTISSKWQSSRFHLRDLWRAAGLSQSASAPAGSGVSSAPQTVRPSPAPSSAPSEVSTPATASAPDNGLESHATAGDGITLQVSATEPTWLSMFADGKRSFTGTLAATESKVLEGRETARLRTGNAGGVNVVFNGKLLGALGPRGQIRTVLFTKEGYEVLDPSAALALTRFSPNVSPMQVRMVPAALHLF